MLLNQYYFPNAFCQDKASIRQFQEVCSSESKLWHAEGETMQDFELERAGRG